MRPSARCAAAVAVLAMTVTGCGTQQAAPDDAVTTAMQAAAEPVGHRVPTVPPADPPSGGALPGTPREAQPVPTTPVLAETVEVHRPSLLVRFGPSTFDALRPARGLAGVATMAGASEFELDLQGPKGASETLTAVAVHPEGFRPLTPEVTAQTVGVWERMLDGEIVLRHDAAHRLGIKLGDMVTVAGPTATREVRVGAFASNGAPPLGDLLVPWELGRELGAPGVNLVAVAATEGADRDELGAAVAEALGGGDVELRDAPEQFQARVVGPVEFEPFSYTELGDGMIVIDPDWVGRWIVWVDLPRVGKTRVHRVMAPQLFAAFQDVAAAGLLEHFKPEQFGGGWVPRHIDWDPSKPLSMHAWGLAIDLNTHDNWLGETPQMDRRVVEIFERWGFEWGGHWKRPDGMHFELDRVVSVDG